MRAVSLIRQGSATGAILSLLLLLSLSLAPSVRADCSVAGPTSVDANQSFTLCGMRGEGLTWEWRGPGVSTSNRTRCISLAGRAAGSYSYVLITRENGREVERCTQVVNVGGGGGGTGSLVCDITGPASLPVNGRAQLCGPSSTAHSYDWTSPSGAHASARCVSADEAGTWTLTIRNMFTGSTRECTYLLAGAGSEEGGCDIVGNTTVTRGGSTSLCGPQRSNVTYRWTGPQGMAATARCISASVPGTYTLTIRNRLDGSTDVCSQRLSLVDDPGTGDDDNADEVVRDNCPRPLGFWLQHCTTGGDPDLSSDELRRLAACIDQRSAHFAWSNDVDGLCKALRPARPLTRRGVLTRDYAVLLANLCASDLGITDRKGDRIGLDPDSGIDVTGYNTVGELAARVERMLMSGRGNFANMSRSVSRINFGRGIGAVCE